MSIHQVGIMDKAKPALSMKVRDCVLMEKSPNHLNHGMITMIPPKIAVVVEKGQVKDLPANLGCSKQFILHRIRKYCIMIPPLLFSRLSTI